ncbi:hypothetical protein D9758_004897 [Tetrapyrgos nigripes]|uniref:Uncharacterized protein n=1 Tax=Tetrapyrgos nigripes TaxID=182062 RepID=A0A8H5G5Y1_9AGAR|nr:hypothetical protein D9758_004897 [Tetrapyrgos nigripes]
MTREPQPLAPPMVREIQSPLTPRKIDSKELSFETKFFEHACQGAPRKDQAYPRDAYYYRPGYECPQQVYPQLLRTCRLVYLEARLLPVKANEHVFWCERAPSGRFNPDIYFTDKTRFTEEQLDAIQNVHIFAQMWWLEDNHFSSLCQTDMRTQILHITIRHSDWWFWEQNRPLRLNERWIASLKHIQGLKTFVLELETMERDKDQMYAIADRLKKKRIEVRDGRSLRTEGNPVVKEQWIGPSAFQGGVTFIKEENRWAHRRKIIGPDAGLTYCTITLTWTLSN